MSKGTGSTSFAISALLRLMVFAGFWTCWHQTLLSDEPTSTATPPAADAATDGAAATSSAAPAVGEAATGEKFSLRYKFQPNEKIRWKVAHRAKVDTTISGTSQTAETTSNSVKVWRLISGSGQGPFVFENSVESLEMRQKLSGREEVHYNSATDKEIPPGFEQAAQSVGVPLTILTIDARGHVVKREDKRTGGTENQGQITLPLPEEAIAVGHVWSDPYDIQVSLRSGEVRQIKSRQRFTLESVSNQVATIKVETQILSPISDRAIEAQLVQRQMAGTVRFDIKAGRILGQEMELDKNVVGFSGESSSLHYVTRFTEELMPAMQQAAAPKAPQSKPPQSKTAAKPAKAPTSGRSKTSQNKQPTRRR